MSSMFHPGMKVVCIEDDVTWTDGVTPLMPSITPVTGKIYTIRRLSIGRFDPRVGLTVEEIPEQTILADLRGVIFSVTILFEATKFRPLVKRKTEISVFKAMLITSKVSEPA